MSFAEKAESEMQITGFDVDSDAILSLIFADRRASRR